MIPSTAPAKHVVRPPPGEDSRPCLRQWAVLWDLGCVLLFFDPGRLGGCPYGNDLLTPTSPPFQLILPSLHLPPNPPALEWELIKDPKLLGKDTSLHSSSAPPLTFHYCEQKETICISPLYGMRIGGQF